MTRRWLLVLGVGAGFIVSAALALVVIPTAAAGIHAWRGARAAQAGADLVRHAELVEAKAPLQSATEHFGSARHWLTSSFAAPMRTVPWVRRQLDGAAALASAGRLWADAAASGVRVNDEQPSGGWINNGRVDLQALERAAQILDDTARRTERAVATIAAVPRSGLVSPLARVFHRAEGASRANVRSLRTGAEGLRSLRVLLGAEGPRRYLVLFSNLAELRGTGGLYGYHSVLTADGGRLRVGASGRPNRDLPHLARSDISPPSWFRSAWERHGSLRLWNNLNLSPHFPTVGRLAAEATGMDGLIQVDGVGIASLLRTSGPVRLKTWPEPITHENLSRIVHHDLYVRIPDRLQRDDFGEELFLTVFRKAVSGGVATEPAALRAFASAVAGGHARMYVRDPAVQRTIVAAGLDGGTSRARDATDVLGVYNLSADGSKQDYFLHREFHLEVQPDLENNTALATLDVTLRDRTPAKALPEYVIGRGFHGAAPRDNAQLLLLTRKQGTELKGVTANGRAFQVSQDEEPGLRSHQGLVIVPARGTIRVRATFLVPQAIERHGALRTYRLRVLHQAMLNAERYRVDVRAPRGWEADHATFEGMLTRETLLTVKLRRAPMRWFGDVLRILVPVL